MTEVRDRDLQTAGLDTEQELRTPTAMTDWTGEVVSVHITPDRSAPIQSVTSARAVPGRGLEGDRYFFERGTYSDRPGPWRELTLIELETIQALARDNELDIAPGDARRNVVTRGAPLSHLVGREFFVGDVRVRGVRLCEPCAHLEGLTRRGILSALVHRGGLRAQILNEGIFGVGDVIRPVPGEDTPPGPPPPIADR